MSFWNRFSFVAHVTFWLWSRLFKVLIIHGPGLFWLREPVLREVLLMVRDRFWLQEPALKRKNVISGPGQFFGPGSQV